MLFLLLIGGLGLMVVLLVREVRLNERQSNFVSAVTHELKTPVASLKLYIDTLQMRDLPEAQRQDFYGTMRQDLDRLNATINNVLNAAMYTDKPVAKPAGRSTSRGWCGARSTSPARATSCRRRRSRYDGPESLRIMGDPGALETAVLNLLDNAVKYSRDQVRVAVELGRDLDGQAVLRVRDQGIGMSRAHLRFIFNRFYRIGAEVRRSHTGTGLGLFIVRSVVKAHRGTVAADSPGQDGGSVFTITLPGALPETAGRRERRGARGRGSAPDGARACCWSRTRPISPRASSSTSASRVTR